MKRTGIGIFSFFLAVGLLIFGYCFSYQKAARYSKDYAGIIDAQQIKSVDTVKEDIVLPTTECILQIYDKTTKQLVEGKLDTLEDFLGKTREEVLNWLDEYMNELPVTELQKGLVAYELLSFSSNKIVLKKTYDSGQKKYEYYLAVFDNEVVVYYSDKKTVFDYTGISTDNLPETELRKLNYGIYVENQEELYGILENYSS